MSLRKAVEELPTEWVTAEEDTGSVMRSKVLKLIDAHEAQTMKVISEVVAEATDDDQFDMGMRRACQQIIEKLAALSEKKEGPD